MFDHIDPTVFWPVLLIVSFVIASAAVWLLATLVDGANPKRRFEQHDRVAERRRNLERNGFKSRIGAR